MDIDQLKRWIKNCEGYNSHLYTDTVGKQTIGYGRNIEDNGILPSEGEYLFENDFKRCEQELSGKEWFENQPEDIKSALLNMNFNLGIARLEGFKKMISALQSKNYSLAATEALNSKWAKQVGKRAKDIAVMIREGNAQGRTDMPD